MRYDLILFSIIYAQGINIFESLFWTKGFWRFKPPYFKNPTKDKSCYHIFLTLAYAAPFISLLFYNMIKYFLLCSTIVWLLNDLCWHFWAVSPRYWLDWFKFYFNPFSKQVLWYVRLKVIFIPVTPRRMFLATIIRIVMIVTLLCIDV